jgi:predicted tellurium resistance membrane protein TerC
LTAVVLQVMLIDVVFSLDSVITAVGISNQLWVMITAILVAAGMMIFFAGRISQFVEEHPTMKILALSFLILIGALLVIEGWDQEAAEGLHLKNYAYFAMAFSVVIELINMRVRKRGEPVQLHNRPHLPPGEAGIAE